MAEDLTLLRPPTDEKPAAVLQSQTPPQPELHDADESGIKKEEP